MTVTVNCESARDFIRSRGDIYSMIEKAYYSEYSIEVTVVEHDNSKAELLEDEIYNIIADFNVEHPYSAINDNFDSIKYYNPELSFKHKMYIIKDNGVYFVIKWNELKKRHHDNFLESEVE